MKITVTYIDSGQVAPDKWESFTRVLHFEEGETLAEVYKKIGFSGNTNVELHFDIGKETNNET